MQFLWKNCRHEIWACTALAGIISFHVGIVVGVFAFKDIAGSKADSTVVRYVGVLIALGGVALIVASGFLYRRHRRHLQPCFCCGEKSDAVGFSLPPFRRLRFAPNLVSPYYIQAVMSDKERKLSTGVSDSKQRMFEMNAKNFQSTVSSSESLYYADTANQSSQFRKDLRKTPC